MISGGQGIGGLGSGEISIVVKIHNQERIAQLTSYIDRQSERIRVLNASYQAGTMSQEQFIRACAPMAINIKRVTDEIEKLQQQMRSGAGMGGGGGMSGMGFMMMSQMIDDMQYGFRSIVNNVPMVGAAIAQSFGMGTAEAMKFGGAMGIAAVAINTWIKNWEDAKAVFGDTEVFRGVQSAIEGIQEAAQKGIYLAVNWTTGTYDQRATDLYERGMADIEKRKEDAESARKSQEGVLSTEEQQNASDFRKAMAEYEANNKGRLRHEMLQKSLRGNPAMMKEWLDEQAGITPNGHESEKRREKLRKVEDTVDIAIGDALKKGQLGMQQGAEFGPEMQAKIEGLRQGRIMEDFQKSERMQSKMGMAERKAKEKEHNDRVRGLMHQNEAQMGIEQKAREKNDKLVDQLNAEGMENQKRWMKANILSDIEDLQDKRDALHERRTEVSKEPSAFTGEYFDYIKKLNELAIDQRKLKKLEDIDAELKKVNQNLKKKQREAAEFAD